MTSITMKELGIHMKYINLPLINDFSISLPRFPGLDMHFMYAVKVDNYRT